MNLKLVKPSTDAEKTTRTTLDTFEVTPDILKSWKVPIFQRELKVNAKVTAIALEIAANDGVIPGVLTIGVLGGERYIIDGQHRREAFMLSGCVVGYVDVRVAHYKTMADMADEFFKLNSQIVKMRPDDYLRALEAIDPQLAKLRKICPFIGYDMVRRGPNAPMLSASGVLRAWALSVKEVPGGGGISAVDAAKQLNPDECDNLTGFLTMAMAAWGRDPEYIRLWGALNLTLCMWLYKRIVLGSYSSKTQRVPRALFQKCLQALSADSNYLDWLVGRLLSDKNRSPGYGRIKNIIGARIHAEIGTKPLLPAPAWASYVGK